MRTITKAIQVFAFDELSARGKENAKQRYAELFGYPFADEAISSIEALAEHFSGRMKYYAIDWFACTHSEARFDMPELEESDLETLVQSLGSFNPETLKGKGDCVLTGYCSDEDAIDGLRLAYHEGERDMEKLMQAAFRSWLKVAQSDCENYYTDEVFGETMDANEMEFTEDGHVFR